MRLETVFRLSTYLTFALACACLGCAEDAILPGIFLFVIPVCLVLAVAFALEGRWTLTPRGANVVAGLIALGALAWMVHYFRNPPEDVAEGSSAAAFLLPYLGPLLMILLLVKAFLPKQVNDFWLLHGLCLIQVALGCGLTGEGLFGVLLFAYLACALWSLMFFYLYRGQLRDDAGRVRGPLFRTGDRPPGQPEGGPGPGGRTGPSPWRYLGLGQAGRAGLVVLAVGLAFFLVTPHEGGKPWAQFIEAGAGRAETGAAAGIDLNRTGEVELNTQVAMEVHAEDAWGNPKNDLSPEQRWRGNVMNLYQGGRWHNHRFGPHAASALPKAAQGRTQLPTLGPDQFFLTFALDPRQSQGFFLADPVLLPDDRTTPPVVSLTTDSPSVFHFQRDGTLLLSHYTPGAKYRYQQVARPPAEPDVRTVGREFIHEAYLCQQPVPRVQDWTRELLERLVAQGKLTKKDLELDPNPPLLPRLRRTLGGQRVPPALRAENREKVARALSEHLAYSGEFTYTLKLRRQDTGVDPSEDFLCNVKEGHCERYATGLTLMLRSCGIPARVVLGFRGAEGQGEGLYYVRRSHAHSWVEALVQRPGPEGKMAPYWLTLDPTPGIEALGAGGFSWDLWVMQGQHSLRVFWRNYILEYNTEQQRELTADLWNRFKPARALGVFPGGTEPWSFGAALGAAFWVLLAALPAVLFGLWWSRRPRAPRPRAATPALVPEVAFYSQLLAVLARRLRLKPQPSQTPRELAEAAERILRTQNLPAFLARVPLKVARLFYQVRYGLRPLSETENDEVERRLAEMDLALAKHS